MDLTPRIGIYPVARFLKHAQNNLVIEKFALVTPLPKNKGLVLKWRRMVPFDVIDTALTEGVTPSPQAVEMETVSATISQYAAWVPLTNVVADMHEDPVFNQTVDLCAQQAAATKEMIAWGVIKAGTNVVWSGTAISTVTVAAPISADDFAAAVVELEGNHCMRLTKKLAAGPNIATEPVKAAYVGLTHTNMKPDIRRCDGFISYEKYGSGGLLDDNEVGSVGEVRVVATQHLTPALGAGSASIAGVRSTGSAVDVYSTIVFGEEAFSVTPLRGMDSAQVGAKLPKFGDSYEDPIGQRGFVAWQFWYVAKILNDQWLVRIESACSSL